MRIQETNAIMKEAQIHRHDDGQYSPPDHRSWMTRLRSAMPSMDKVKTLIGDRRVRAAAGAVGTLLVLAISASMRPKKRTGWRAMMPS
ncbi:MAG TPA: hypothetical protein VHL58_12000 [Thermoanaerobaculia bacterium]|nr:hypothetical protein [Thermoanaerobaculia bacterium]